MNTPDPGTYPIKRTPEQGHERACLARAMICAIQNMRDAAGSNFDFRIMAQENLALVWADEYLSDGITACYCTDGEV